MTELTKPDLTQRLMEIGKYEIGADEFDRMKNGEGPAMFAFMFKSVTLTMEGLALAATANIAYNGNYNHAGKIAAVVAGIECIKFSYSRVEPKISSFLNKKLFEHVIKDE